MSLTWHKACYKLSSSIRVQETFFAEGKSKLSLFLYATSPEGSGARLVRILKQRLPDIEIEVLRTIEDLSNRLLKGRYDSDIAIVLISNKRELEKLIFIQELLDRIPFILVVQDSTSDSDLLSKGHLLKPRFISDSSCGFIDVAAVLKKMMDARKVCQDETENKTLINSGHFEMFSNMNNEY